MKEPNVIEIKHGDIFKSKAQAIVNPVNCVGVMGAGLAKQFKFKFPGNFQAYKQACSKGELQIGKVFTHTESNGGKQLCIMNFPTKKHWRDPSEISYIEDGLRSLHHEMIRINLKSISIPAIGCGLGGLKWEDVLYRIEWEFSGDDGLVIEVFKPKQ